jgi:hypothetical protein
VRGGGVLSVRKGNAQGGTRELHDRPGMHQLLKQICCNIQTFHNDVRHCDNSSGLSRVSIVTLSVSLTRTGVTWSNFLHPNGKKKVQYISFFGIRRSIEKIYVKKDRWNR